MVRTVVCDDDAREPVNINANSSFGWFWLAVENRRYEEDLTQLEKVDASLVSAYVKVVFEHSSGFEPQLGEIVSAVIADEDDPIWF